MDIRQAETLLEEAAEGELGTLGPDRWPRPVEVRLSWDGSRGGVATAATGSEDDVALIPIYEADYPSQVVVTDPITLLSRFVTLAGTHDVREFARFAQRWGMLGLCSAHGLPCAHEPGGCGLRYRAAEVVADWRWYALQAQRVLEVARDARSNDLRARAELEGIVRRWSTWAGVAPHLTFDEKQRCYRIELGSGSLFGHLAALLTYAAAGGGPRILPCKGGCGRWITPKGRQRYCSDCGTRVAHRIAKQTYRQRNREAPDRPRSRRGRSGDG